MKKLEFPINGENRLSICDDAAIAVYDYACTLIKDKKECLRYRLAVEDCLLKWLDETSIGHKLTLAFKKPIIGSPIIELKYNGPKFNPLESIDDEYEYSTRILLGLAPLYVYRSKENIVHFDLKSADISSINKLIKILILSVIIGYAGSLFIPENILILLVANVLTPVNDVFLNILNCIAGPMIFLSVSIGIYGIGDTSTLSKVGNKMINIFIRNDFLAGIMCIVLFPVFGLTLNSSSFGTSQFSGLFQMILDIVPSNIVDPFSNGNTLQIIFLAFAMGIALLFLGKKTDSIVKAVNQINCILQFFMEAVSSLVPYFVFIVIVSMFWSGNIGTIGSTWKFFACLLSAIVVFSALLLCYVAFRSGISVLKLLKICLPSFLIAITTASSAASFSCNTEICKKKLGIDDSIANFGIPLGMVIHNPITVINNITFAFFFASLGGTKYSVMWLISAVFIGTVLAIASPPIPGGSAVVYTMLFLQLGISNDYLPLVFAIDMISDFLVTAFEMICLTPALLDVSERAGMTNKEILLKEHG